VTARTRIVLVLGVGLLATLLERAPGLLALCGAAAVALLRTGSPWQRPVALGLAAAALSTVVSQGLFWAGAPRTPWLAVGPVVVWREGVVHGAVQSLRFVATTLAGAALALSTPPDRLASGLVALRVPGGAAFLATTALRFVPLALEEWRTVRRARARRGAAVAAWRLDLRLVAEAAMLRPVIARAIRRSVVLAESLELRGFDPARAPVAPDARPGPADHAAVVGLGLVVVAVAGSRAVFWAWTRGLLTEPALRPWMGFVRWWC
jgi:energy-coupling factor transport system permease protein